MTLFKFNPILPALVLGATLFFAACDKDDDNNGSSGRLNMEITDSPVDDPNVKAVFITVAEVKVDGETFSGFSGKKTINLLAYQQGNVALLGLGDLDAGTYHNVTLVLDTKTDASGNAPGCYVQTVDNVKHELSTSATETLTTAHNFTVSSGATTNVVIDFVLRKAVMSQSGGGSDQYDFVATADLEAALRLVVKNESGKVEGTIQNSIINTAKIVAFVYEKGDYTRSVEIVSTNGISFKNAVASAVVGSNGDFSVPFLDRGDYEIHFAAFSDFNDDGKLEFQGTLILTSLLDLDNLHLTSTSNLDLNIMVTGILP